MAAIEIGKVKSGKGETYGVKWDERTREVYVVEYFTFFSNSVRICSSKASSAGDAMRVAEAHLYNK